MTPFRISLAVAGAVAALGTGAAFAAAGPTAVAAFINHGDAVSSSATTTCPDSTAADRDAHGKCVSKIAKGELGEKSKPSTSEHQPETTSQNTTAGTDKSNHGQAVSEVAKSSATEGRAHGEAVSTIARTGSEQGGNASATADRHGASVSAKHQTPSPPAGP